MINNIGGIKTKIMLVRLRLELKNDYLSDYQKRMLRRYGESSTGNSIVRDILIPSDMPLHNLHYSIQKLFGWQNSHLRSFYLPKDVYNKLTGGTESLLERLEVNKVIAAQGEDIDFKELFPVTKELIYNYDFGDNWVVRITKYKDCKDLLKNNIVDEYELEKAQEIVLDKHKPVCINKEGISVLDDVGGLSGFADFLGVIYEGEDKEEASSARAWAKSLGWSDRKVSNKMML